MNQPETFFVVPGEAIASVLRTAHSVILDLVRSTYLAHANGKTINPDSYFLRFPDKPDARIIALPAAVTHDQSVAGIKWIASYPANTLQNLQRASATLVLNDYSTGYPKAILEASQISACRTAASAVLAASVFTPTKSISRLSVIGTGIIARKVVEYLFATGWTVDELVAYDLNPEDAKRFLTCFSDQSGSILQEISATRAIIDSTHVVLATTASTPYLIDISILHAGQVVLNLSLRDLAPELILASNNIMDDVDHCLKASTSPHLAEQTTGNRDFVTGTLAQLIEGEIQLDLTRPIIFSPFGLGVLDIALGNYLLTQTVESGDAIAIDSFFPDMSRW